jgi:hypothetical protein
MRKSNWQRTVDREVHRARLAEIFSDVGKCSAEDILNHPFRKGRLAAPVDEEEEEIPEADVVEEESDEGELTPDLEAAIAAVILANPSFSKTEAAHYLLHSADGRAMLRHLNKGDNTMPTPTYESVLKDNGGLTAVCKRITDANDAGGLTERQLTKLAEIEFAKQALPGEKPATTFARLYSAPENVGLRKAIAIAKGHNFGTARSHGF